MLNKTKLNDMFKLLGYYKEYYVDGRFIGTVNNVEKDRDVLGYFGQREEIVNKTIILSNKKRIKAGTVVNTQLHQLNGRK